jgi:hypothetical protein
MHSKERTAWAWLICLIFAPVIYFIVLRNMEWVAGNADLSRIAALSMPLVTLALVALGVRAWNVVKARHQGQDLLDERDLLIERQSTSVAYHVMLTGLIVVGIVMPFSATRWEIIDTSFFFIVLAEVIRSSLTIYAYRKGIHA